MSLSEKLNKFLSAPMNEAPVFKRSFVSEFQSSYNGATDKLWRGMMEIGVLSDNIPATAMSYTNNHRRRTQNIMKGVLNLIVQGVKVQLSYYKAAGMDLDYNVKTTYWDGKIKQLLNHMKSVDNKVKGMWHSQAEADADSKLAEYQGRSNSDFANSLYPFLTEKYDWRDFHVVTYNPLHGGSKHWVHWCNGFKRFRTHGRNLVVASVDQRKRAIDKSYVRVKLRETSTRVCEKPVFEFLPNFGGQNCRLFPPFTYDREAHAINETQLPSEFRVGCKYAAVGVIKKNADVHHRAPSNRLVTEVNYSFILHAFG